MNNNGLGKGMSIMRVTDFLTVLAIAVTVSLAGCQKADNVNGCLRVVTISFSEDAATRTDISGDAPIWLETDRIWVSDGTGCTTVILNGTPEEGEVKGVLGSDGKSFSFTTSLTGELYAVYPASSAPASPVISDGKLTLTIPDRQDGTYACANICAARGTDELKFKNVASILRLTQGGTTGVEGICLSTANAIAGPITVSFSGSGNEWSIASESLTGLSSKEVIVSSGDALSEYYIAVAPVATGATTLFFQKTDKTAKATKTGTTLVRNKIYTLGEMPADGKYYKPGRRGEINGHEYVEIDGLRWATQNLAITESGKSCWKGTSLMTGDYFQWGAAKSDELVYSSFTWNGTICNIFPLSDRAFDEEFYAPLYKDGSYTKYTSADGLTCLKSADDAASVSWQSTWRMPTKNEFEALMSNTTCTYDGDRAGFSIKSGSDELLFLPATGYGSGSKINSDDSHNTNYWTSTLYESYEDEAYCLILSVSESNPVSFGIRALGCPVRPVSD